MKNVVLLIALAFLWSCVSPPDQNLTQTPEVISLRSEFNALFANNSKEARGQLVTKHLMENHREVYSNLVFSTTTLAQQKELFEKFLPKATTARQNIDATFSRIEDAVTKTAISFNNALPSGDYNYKVYILPSFFQFSGRAGFVTKNQIDVAFGADNISQHNENLSILVAHEMFHALHFQTLKLSQAGLQEFENLNNLLFIEGLAVLAAAKVNNLSIKLESALGRIGGICEQKIDSLKSAYFADLSKGTPKSEELIDRWFGSGDEKLGIPPMSGYCLGFLTAKNLSEKHGLQEMLQWNPVQKAPEIREALLAVY
jgi:uncharacterized protein YjaZ